MGLEQARRAIEHSVRVFLGSTLSAAWSLAPGILTFAENVEICVEHENCHRPYEAISALERAIERTIRNTTGETKAVKVNHGLQRTRVRICRMFREEVFDRLEREEKRCDVKRQIETAALRAIRNVESMTWGANPADPVHIKVLKIKHGFAHWTNGETGALAERIKDALRENTRLNIWGIRCGQTETEVHIFNQKPSSTPEANAPHTFFAKGLNIDEPRLIIRDELADWTREQTKKKTEERKMFEVNEIVAITEGSKAIQLVEHKEETQKEMTMTAQVAAQYQNDTVRKVDVAGDVLVLHVGHVKD